MDEAPGPSAGIARGSRPDWGMFAILILSAGLVVAGMIMGFSSNTHSVGLAQIECQTLPDLATSPNDPITPPILLDSDMDIAFLESREGIREGLDRGYDEELQAALWYIDKLGEAECARRARREWWKPVGLIGAGLAIAGTAGAMWVAKDPAGL